MYKNILKRFFDLIFSIIALIILMIPMIVVAIIIKIDSPGPVLFKQRRVGYKKKIFTIYKFRSMPVTVPKDIPTHQFASKNLLSKWQKLMRKTSIDELPQLFNILFGQMSVCGPRPALWNQEDLIAEREKYGANDVKPDLPDGHK